MTVGVDGWPNLREGWFTSSCSDVPEVQGVGGGRTDRGGRCIENTI